MIEALFLLLGLALGGAAGAVLAGGRARAELRAERLAAGAREQALRSSEVQLRDAFKSMSGDALAQANAEFLKLAKATLDTTVKQAEGDLGKRQAAIDGLVKPLAESLKQYEAHVKTLEEKRQKAYGSLEKELAALNLAQRALQKETTTLATALRNPKVRGQWGEVALQRAVELGGMTEHCDFVVQRGLDGHGGRPDALVQLPGGRTLAVDAKAPLAGYLEALEAPGEPEREAALDHFARQVRAHLKGLCAKAYWEGLQPAPEFVVMFLPGEAFFAAALERDPQLIEDGAAANVILATPTTLIALLRAVHHGWRQEKVAQNAQQVSDLGRELHERLAGFASHLARVGAGLDRSVEAYNAAVGSLESRVLVSARRFEDLGASGGKDIEQLEPVLVAPRRVQAALVDVEEA